MQPGLYSLNKILIKVGNITFYHNASVPEASSFELLQNDEASLGSSANSHKPCIQVYPQPKAFEAQADHCKDIHLEKTRSVEITISSGRNDISGGKLSVRAGTAGLRVHTAEAEVSSAQLEITDRSKPDLLLLGELAAESNAKIRAPYTLESDVKEITVRLEVTYTTEHGDFTFACAPRISVLLPLGVWGKVGPNSSFRDADGKIRKKNGRCDRCREKLKGPNIWVCEVGLCGTLICGGCWEEYEGDRTGGVSRTGKDS